MKIRDRLTRGVDTSGPLRGRGKTTTVSGATKGAGPADLVFISGRGVDIQRARQLALQAPEIRQALVEQILGQMERGEYQVSGQDVAPKMIREHMMELRE